MNPFSICIIVKNEERNIVRCLKSLQMLDCEIILCDTGSTDNTVSLASPYVSKIIYFRWIQDFSAARNYSISQASNDWVLILDCDEWAESADVAKFMDLSALYPDHMGLLKRINLQNPDNRAGAYTDWVPRFFNRRYFTYDGRIHEQVVSLSGEPLNGFRLPLTILHSGYVGTPEELAPKHERNITMLEKELAAAPDHPYYNFQMGQEYYNLFEYEKALDYYSKVISNDLSPGLEYHRLTVIAYGDCLIHTPRKAEALALKKFEETFGGNPDFSCLMGMIYLANNKPLEAMPEFIKALSMDNPYKEGTNTYLPWYFLGLINESFDNYAAARSFYEKCGEFALAKNRLAALDG